MMHLPEPGEGVIVLWLDTVDTNAWQGLDSARLPQNDHDSIECRGRYLGKTKDGYIHIGNQSSIKSGEVGKVGFVSDILLKSVLSITITPEGTGKVIYAVGTKGRKRSHKEGKQPQETASVERCVECSSEKDGGRGPGDQRGKCGSGPEKAEE